MLHTRLQIDPNAQVILRPGGDQTYEIVALDPASECSAVIELNGKQVAAIAEAASEM